MELGSPNAAVHLVDMVEDAASSLNTFPNRFPLVEEEPWRNNGIRKIAVHNYIVYYWVDEPRRKVQVIGIIYGGSNQRKALEELKRS